MDAVRRLDTVCFVLRFRPRRTTCTAIDGNLCRAVAARLHGTGNLARASARRIPALVPSAWPGRIDQSRMRIREDRGSFLDEWANCLQKRYDAMYGAGGEQDVLKRTADYMLCAAKTRAIRWQAYLRYALAQSPECVRQIFDTFTKNEFPDVPWQSYVDQMEDLRCLLKSVPAGKPQSAAPAPSAAVRSKLQGIAGRPPLRLAA